MRRHHQGGNIMTRKIIKTIHPIAGATGLLTITAFWAATVYSLLSGDPGVVLRVKTGIVYGLFLLVPAMAAVRMSPVRLVRHIGHLIIGGVTVGKAIRIEKVDDISSIKALLAF